MSVIFQRLWRKSILHRKKSWFQSTNRRRLIIVKHKNLIAVCTVEFLKQDYRWKHMFHPLHIQKKIKKKKLHYNWYTLNWDLILRHDNVPCHIGWQVRSFIKGVEMHVMECQNPILNIYSTCLSLFEAKSNNCIVSNPWRSYKKYTIALELYHNGIYWI